MVRQLLFPTKASMHHLRFYEQMKSVGGISGIYKTLDRFVLWLTQELYILVKDDGRLGQPS